MTRGQVSFFHLIFFLLAFSVPVFSGEKENPGSDGLPAKVAEAVENGNIKRAVFEYGRYVKRLKGDDRTGAVPGFARFLIKYGRYEDAWKLVGSSMESEPWQYNGHLKESYFAACEVRYAQGKYLEAAKLFEKIGKNVNKANIQARAGEGVARCLLKLGRINQAFDFAKMALKASRADMKDEYGVHDGTLHGRIQKLIKKIQGWIDMDSYGQAFVMYREAERLRRKKGKYLPAVLKYEDIAREFSGSVFSEAAEAYAVKCLIKLARPENMTTAKKFIAAREKELSDKRLCLKNLKNRDDAEKLKTEIGRTEKFVTRLKAMPLGPSAFLKAGERATAFIRKNRFGLYRGEVMLAVGEYVMKQNLDPDATGKWHNSAWEWLSGVEKHDAGLDAFKVPEKAREASASPGTETRFDTFGNVKKREVKIGAVLNRTTCKWYLDDLRESCALVLGFLAFYRGDRKTALSWYGKIPELDRATARLDKAGEWNNYKRLKWGAEHGYLFAYPAELRLYKGRVRFAVLLGDFYASTDRFSEAERIYRRVLSGELEKLGSKERDYPEYALATCLYWQKGRKKAFEQYLKVLANRDRTFTEDRAMYAAGKISRELSDEGKKARGLKLLRELALSGRRNEFAYKAMITYGRRLIKAGSVREGRQILSAVPKSAKDYYKLAQYFLKREKTKQAEKEKTGG